jgi:hypothetical protein
MIHLPADNAFPGGPVVRNTRQRLSPLRPLRTFISLGYRWRSRLRGVGADRPRLRTRSCRYCRPFRGQKVIVTSAAFHFTDEYGYEPPDIDPRPAPAYDLRNSRTSADARHGGSGAVALGIADSFHRVPLERRSAQGTAVARCNSSGYLRRIQLCGVDRDAGFYHARQHVPSRTCDSVTHGVSTVNGIDPFSIAGQPLVTPKLWFDICAFTIPAAGFLGNAGWNILRGPGISNVDF